MSRSVSDVPEIEIEDDLSRVTSVPGNVAADSFQYERPLLDTEHENIRRTQSVGDMSEYGLDTPFDLSDSERLRIHSRYRAPRSVEEKHQQMNALFGIRPFKPSVTNKPMEEHSSTFKQLYQEPIDFSMGNNI